MHSFQPSRGRILFEVLCAVGIAASCGGAWLQTGASALLAAAAVATLYGLVHFFDLFRRDPEVAIEPQRIEFEPTIEVESVPAQREYSEPPPVAVEPRLVVDNAAEEMPPAQEAEAIEPALPSARAERPTKGPRKTGGRRAAAPKKAKAAEPAPAVAEEAEFELSISSAPAQPVEAEPDDESFHPPVAPLFEPEPFVRQQQRTMFGRKSG